MSEQKKLPTIAMTPMPEFGYDPIPLILSGEKVHTLRKQRHHGRKEVTVNGKRAGIVLEFVKHEKMSKWDYVTYKFALADGFRRVGNWRPGGNLRRFLIKFYGEVPETLWCSHFRVVERPADELVDS